MTHYYGLTNVGYYAQLPGSEAFFEAYAQTPNAEQNLALTMDTSYNTVSDNNHDVFIGLGVIILVVLVAIVAFRQNKKDAPHNSIAATPHYEYVNVYGEDYGSAWAAGILLFLFCWFPLINIILFIWLIVALCNPKHVIRTVVYEDERTKG